MAKRTTNSSRISGTDLLIITLVFLLNAIGLITLYGVTADGPSWMQRLVWRQILWSVIGIAGLFLMIQVGYKKILKWGLVFYLIGVISVALPLILGMSRKGAHSWLIIGKISLQPTEFAKIALIIMLAKVLGMRTAKQGLNIWIIAAVGILTGIPGLIIAKQPDLGSAVVFLTIALGLLFLAGISRYILIVIILGLATAGVLIYPHLKQYQKDRIEVFLNPRADSLNKGYNVVQSEIAIGSGQIWGKGLGQGSQTKYRFLPEHYSDFIFAGLVEQFGLIGGSAVLLIYACLLFLLQRLARQSKDEEAYFIICGTMMLITTHVVFNAGMSMGLLPVTGLPLPWLSYGGSSLITSYLSMGLALGCKQKSYIFSRE